MSNIKKTSKKAENKNDKIMQKFMVNQIGLLAQSIFVLFALVFGIATIFQGEFMVIFELLMGCSLAIMAYNNLKMYKRTLFTIPYILGALIAFFAAFEVLLGL